MKVIKRSTLPGGDNLIIEDWSENYPNLPDRYMVVAYPVSKACVCGTFAPKAGMRFRCGFWYPSVEAAENVFSALKSGISELSDFADHMERPDYLPCI